MGSFRKPLEGRVRTHELQCPSDRGSSRVARPLLCPTGAGDLGNVRLDVNKILLTFAFLSLMVLPPTLLLGIFILIIWHYHKKTLSKPA